MYDSRNISLNLIELPSEPDPEQKVNLENEKSCAEHVRFENEVKPKVTTYNSVIF